MKGLQFILPLALIVMACSGGTEKTEETLGKSYGPVSVDTSKALTVDGMLKDFAGKSGEVEYTFVGEIAEVCSKAGCWVNIDKGNGETFMVRFKDHFTIPPKTDVGTEAYFHGIAYNDTVTVDLLRHFAEDAGKSQEEIDAITEPVYEMGFEADGIVLKKKKK